MIFQSIKRKHRDYFSVYEYYSYLGGDYLIMKHNYEIILELRNDLNDDDKNFIIQKINNLKDRFELIQEGNKIFKYENNLSYDDVPYCIMFCMHISKFKSIE